MSITPSVISTVPVTPVTPVIPVIPAVPIIPVVLIIPANMANRYAPLQLPSNAGALPQDYQSKITYFDSTGSFTAIQHAKITLKTTK